jgi:predicted DsbA family dithiol-disulfide isomerase
MKIEIWSDIACPFCYIGKRHLEQALSKFNDSIHFDIEWKSYQLQPDLQITEAKGLDAFLAEIKGWSLSQAQEMNQQVSQMAQASGLNYQLDKAIVANTLKAHQLIQLAKSQSLGDAAEEALFKAYFIEGKDLNDENELCRIAEGIGISGHEISSVLKTQAYVDEIKREQFEAQQLLVRGVPFFLFNDQYAISGAQPVETFESVIQQILTIEQNGQD